MDYDIRFEPNVVRRDIPSIPPAFVDPIMRAIHERLTVLPEGAGKPLRHNLKGCWRLRVGEWRVLYRIDGRSVSVFSIVIRRDVYKKR